MSLTFLRPTCDVKVPVREHTPEHSLSNLSALLGALALHARNCEFALVFGEPPYFGTGGQARVEEEASDTDRQADRTIDDLDRSVVIQTLLHCLQLTKSHLQPLMPATPFRPLWAAACK